MPTSPSEAPSAAASISPVASAQTTQTTDLAVIGAGPAGLAAAIAAADAGLAVAVLDLGERIGGQYFRHTAAQEDAADGGPLHHAWDTFAGLRDRFRAQVAAGRIVYRPRHSVWSIAAGDPYVTVRALEDEVERTPRQLLARAVVIATGAHDRQLPFPGWTLPGVMAAGGAQSLLKGSAVAAGTRAVVAGTGPLLLPVADGLLAAGVDVAEIVEANAPWRLASRAGALPGLVLKAAEVAAYGRRLVRRRVPLRTRQAVVTAHGDARLEAVTVARIREDWTVVAGSERRIDCDLLAVGYGFTPQIELALAAGCEHALGADGSLALRADSSGRTTQPRIYAAGETTGVGGWELAAEEGRACGLAAAADLGASGASPRTRSHSRTRLRRETLRRFALALGEAYRVRDGWITWLDDETLVCRCEEVAYADVRAALSELGAGDVRTVKLLARPGMGLCQGRICGRAVAELTARHRGRGVSAEDLLATSRRTLATPVPLGVLAQLNDPQAGLLGRDTGL